MTLAGQKAAIICNEGQKTSCDKNLRLLYNLFYVSENAMIEKPKRAIISEYELCKSAVEQSLKQKSAEDEKLLMSSLYSISVQKPERGGAGA